MTPKSRPIADETPDENASDTLPAGPILDYQGEDLSSALAPPPMLEKPATYRTLFWLALPTLVEQVISGLIGLTDTLVAGHGKDEHLNAAASAAVGTMTYMMWFCGLMGSALGVGATAIVSRSYGARRYRVAQRVAGTAISSAFLLGVVVAGTLYVFASQIVTVFGLDGIAHEYGVKYLHIMSATIFLQTVGQIGLACMRGAGDLVRPLMITATMAVVNLITVPALAFGWFGLPAWGIQGNATGTMIAFAISGTATVGLLLSGKAKLKLQLRHFRIIPHVLWRILRISLPSWAEGMLLWGGQFFIVIFVIRLNDAALGKVFGETLSHISGLTMSTHNAVLRVESFAFLPGFGFGIATSALVGQYLGARRPAEARHSVFIANRLAVGVMTLVALPMIVIPGILMHGMVDNRNAVAIGFWPMIIAGLAQPGFAVAIIMGSALRGAGDTVSVMLSTITGMFVVRVPIMFTAVWVFTRMGHPEWALIAVWIGIFADLNYRAGFNTIVFLRGKWQQKEV